MAAVLLTILRLGLTVTVLTVAYGPMLLAGYRGRQATNDLEG